MENIILKIIELASTQPLTATVLLLLLGKWSLELGIVGARKASGRNGSSTIRGQLDTIDKKQDQQTETLNDIHTRLTVVEKTTDIIERHCPLMSQGSKP